MTSAVELAAPRRAREPDRQGRLIVALSHTFTISRAKMLGEDEDW